MPSEKFKPAYLLPKYWLSWLAVVLSWALARLPLSWQRGLSRWLARRLANNNSNRMQIIRRNIDLCFPEKSAEDRQALLTANLESSMLMMFDLLNLVWRAPETMIDPVEVLGAEYLEQALAADKPVLLVSGHFTALFSAAMRITAISPLDIVYRRMDNPLLEAHIYQRLIQSNPVNAIHRKDIRDMLVKLKAGKGAVVIVPDQDFGVKRGTFIPFFGIPTATITTIPQYAEQADAQVLLFSAHWEGQRCVVEIEPALENFPSGDDIADTQIWSDWLERKVRQHPEDYLWLHKRFKTRPEGEASFYKKG
ncbi:MAG: lysophospholipid acyltransferase family protein [Porticoccaceae bacterium]